MNEELSKNLRCVVVRGGIDLWIEEEKIQSLKSAMESKKIVVIDENVVNTVDIIGIFTSEAMEERNHKKNGQWKCRYEEWHDRGEPCGHVNSLGYKQ